MNSPAAVSSSHPGQSSHLQELLGLELLYHPRRQSCKAPSFYATRRRQLLFGKYAHGAVTSPIMTIAASSADQIVMKSDETHTSIANINDNYLLLRQKLLSRKFGPPPSLSTHTSLAQRSAHNMGVLQAPQEEEPHTLKAPIENVKDIYSFTGMAAFFDHHKQPVLSVQFANNDNDVFACASKDGTISVCRVSQQQVVLRLVGHGAGVTDFEWSMANDFILSTSMDQTVRIWDAKTGECKRVVQDTAETLTCAFCPVNNNLFVVGSRKSIKVYNMSTGKELSSANLGAAGIPKCMTFDPHGHFIFIGDDQGNVHVFEFSSIHGRITKLSKTLVSPDKTITSLCYSEYLSRRRNDIFLLANCNDNQLHVLSLVSTRAGLLKENITFPIQHQHEDIRSVFCPLLSIRSAPCVVTGTEDMSVNIYDLNQRTLVSQLKGHSAAVLSVGWSYDESLLASSDAMGVVIVWRRIE